MAYSVATQHIQTDSKKGTYHLIELNLDNRSLSIGTFRKDQLEEANKKYMEIERRIVEGEKLQTVLVSAGSIKNLRRAYPNYFLDTREFIKHLDYIEKKC